MQDVEEANFPAFLTDQTSSRMRTWKANKELKKSSQRDRLYLQKRVETITGKGTGKYSRKKLTLAKSKEKNEMQKMPTKRTLV